jgi:hypothetical protein
MEERAANGGMTKREMAAMHTFMCKMSDMKPPDANEIGSANQAKEMQNDYTTGLAALTEWSRMRKVKQDNPWEKAEGYIASASLPGIHVDFTPFAYQTCMDVQEGFLYTQPDYDRSMRPARSCDIMLGRKLGTGCQLKYADLPMSKRLTINKFVDSDKRALMTFNVFFIRQ